MKEMNLVRGFLPAADPVKRLSSAFAPWESVAANLPKLLVSDQLRKTIKNLPRFDTARLQSDQEIERAMVILSFLGHGYVWGEKEPINAIPATLAVPWHEVATALGRPPILSYASYALHNWRRFNPDGPVALGNIALLQNFLGGIDEEWFILIHVDIEAKAAPLLPRLLSLQKAVATGDPDALLMHLNSIAADLKEICKTMNRMVENCDPYIYYNRVRPYIHGWKDNPGLPNGLIYEGVKEYSNVPQKFRGETGAQSGIIPSLDGALNISHENDPLRFYLKEMREYMPPLHSNFVSQVEQGPSVRDYIINQHENYPALKEAYNECVGLVETFRSTHLKYAAQYIQKQSQTSTANSTLIGTGGTPFLKYLNKHKRETSEHIIT